MEKYAVYELEGRNYIIVSIDGEIVNCLVRGNEEILPAVLSIDRIESAGRRVANILEEPGYIHLFK